MVNKKLKKFMTIKPALQKILKGIYIQKLNINITVLERINFTR
jgi:hypothetical protein